MFWGFPPPPPDANPEYRWRKTLERAGYVVIDSAFDSRRDTEPPWPHYDLSYHPPRSRRGNTP